LGTEILISQATRSRLEGDVPLKALPATRVRGRTQPVEIYALA
jgi:class 3 adenylate cyclase